MDKLPTSFNCDTPFDSPEHADCNGVRWDGDVCICECHEQQMREALALFASQDNVIVIHNKDSIENTDGMEPL